jgi:hypothetical protein
MTIKITGYETHGKHSGFEAWTLPLLTASYLDVRFPTGLSGDGTDAM